VGHRRVAFLVSIGATVAAGALLPQAVLSSSGTSAAARLAAFDSDLLAEINAARAAAGLAPLAASRQLAAAAAQHSGEMLADGYFGHDSADGAPFWKRIAAFYPPARSRSWSVGENLLAAGPSLDAHDALAMWMASPPHRENLLSPGWRAAGIAAASSSDPGGALGDAPVVVVTADFAARA